ncbi:hypothetical protein M405DRAFT_865678 [Rhizopogon salebrosus TDB-379]|nr:hypothetical protein M405DRAFT_865678 [Rhizopogon salebrosus TDB-379]
MSLSSLVLLMQARTSRSQQHTHIYEFWCGHVFFHLGRLFIILSMMAIQALDVPYRWLRLGGEMQAVISSFPHFSQTSAGRLSFVCQLFTRHRTSTGTHRVHQYTSSLTSNAFPPGGLPPPHSTHIAVAAAMRLSVQVSTTRLPLTNILYIIPLSAIEGVDQYGEPLARYARNRVHTSRYTLLTFICQNTDRHRSRTRSHQAIRLDFAMPPEFSPAPAWAYHSSAPPPKPQST